MFPEMPKLSSSSTSPHHRRPLPLSFSYYFPTPIVLEDKLAHVPELANHCGGTELPQFLKHVLAHAYFAASVEDLKLCVLTQPHIAEPPPNLLVQYQFTSPRIIAP